MGRDGMIWLVALGVLILIACIGVLNTLTFPRLRPARLRGFPSVSILVPARNEAEHIEETLNRLLGLKYPDFEVVVLDDASVDDTFVRAQTIARRDPRLSVVRGQPLPAGWLGKNWACHQLAQRAKGEILIFTDADVRWEPAALDAVLHLLQQTHADLLTVWPTQETVTWSERLVVPMMMFTIINYLPELAVRYMPWPVFAAANGQCMAFRRSAYQRIGGHAAVRANVVEDMGLAWNIKRHRMHLVMAEGNWLIHTRMYRTWTEVRDGFAKNILAGHGNKPFFLILSGIFHWWLFVVPWLWLPLGWLLPWHEGWPWLPLMMVVLGGGVRALSAAVTHQRLQDALLLPLSNILMTVIAGQALVWHYRYGGPRWKGRTLARQAEHL
ncbi:MAG: glycosyltransferase family 2 protein [Anaerolineae bacterium]|nr:glycosyltransferase family 2 protein [Anaerolineae bacterium]MDW8072053.1 glycosyltransferase family 2 protein [Anaerolineae bacterium]